MISNLELKRIRKTPIGDVFLGPKINSPEQLEQLRREGLRIGNPHDYLYYISQGHYISPVAFDVACVLLPKAMTNGSSQLLLIKDDGSYNNNLASRLLSLNHPAHIEKRQIRSSEKPNIREEILLEGTRALCFFKKSSREFEHYGETSTCSQGIREFKCAGQNFSQQADSELIQRFFNNDSSFREEVYRRPEKYKEFEPLRLFSFLFSELNHYPQDDKDWSHHAFNYFWSNANAQPLSLEIDELKPLEIRQVVAYQNLSVFSVETPGQVLPRLYVPQENYNFIREGYFPIDNTFVNLRDIQDSLARLNLGGLEKQLFEDLVKNGEIK